jgi:hypothetical protein
VRRYPVWYDAPRTRDMGRIHLIAGSAEIARRRRLVPPGHLVEAWQDLRIPDRFWVGDEAKALLDATGVPLPAELSLDDDRVPIFYGARLDHIESLPTEASLRARVVSAGGMAVAWITVNAFGERTEYEPQSPSDPIFFLRRPRGDTAHIWRLFRSRHDAIAYMREHFGRDPEALEWAEHLSVQDYEELIGGRPGGG